MVLKNIAALSAGLLAGDLLAADWPQWMGPGRNGIAASTPAVAVDFSARPQLAWSHPLAEEKLADYSSPIIAAGRVYALGCYAIAATATSPAAGQTRTSEHVLRCWDLTAGKEFWVQRWPAPSPRFGAGSTPAYADSRLFLIDCGGVARCFAAGTGQLLWERKVGPGTWYFPNHHSPLVVGDKVIFQAVPLVALDVATGKVVWERKEVADSHSSPALWMHEGSPYVVCSRFTGGRKGAGPTNRLFCVDAADGRIVWQVPECSTEGSPCVTGDFVAFTKGAWLRQGYEGKGDLSVWRLAMDKPELLADVPLVCGHFTPASDGKHVWAYGKAGAQTEAIAFDIAQRKVVSRCTFRGSDDGYTSPIVADGHLLLWGGNRMIVLDARTPTLKVLAEHPLAKTKWNTPAFAEGFLVTRDQAVNCYRFEKREQPKEQQKEQHP